MHADSADFTRREQLSVCSRHLILSRPEAETVGGTEYRTKSGLTAESCWYHRPSRLLVSPAAVLCIIFGSRHTTVLPVRLCACVCIGTSDSRANVYVSCRRDMRSSGKLAHRRGSHCTASRLGRRPCTGRRRLSQQWERTLFPTLARPTARSSFVHGTRHRSGLSQPSGSHCTPLQLAPLFQELLRGLVAAAALHYHIRQLVEPGAKREKAVRNVPAG